MENNNYFLELNKIDVSSFVEKKNGMNYLSWAYAWQEIKAKFPDANYKIYERENGVIYWDDGKTAWVKTGVTINGIEHIEYLPIMDYRNQSIPVEKITSFAVNTAIQRSLTKACARHGLGLYIYAGEDLPVETAEKQAETKNILHEGLIDIKNTIELIIRNSKDKDDAAKRKTLIANTIKSYVKTKDGKSTSDYRIITDVNVMNKVRQVLKDMESNLTKGDN